jgi:hypothetical protein
MLVSAGTEAKRMPNDNERRSKSRTGGVPPAERPGTLVDRQTAGPPAPAAASSTDVADFLQRVRSLAPAGTAGHGRLVFAMDATMSRQPTWDMALALQAEMFHAVKSVGGLDVQLVYFRGAGECRASKWVTDADALARLMTTVDCRGGYTQIGRVLAHARQETEKRKISALVYVGDCMEELADELCGRAGELALHGVPVFLFQEGRDAKAELTFREIARLTNGAFCRFDQGSADQLRELLAAVAVFAAGGRVALQRLSNASSGSGARLLLEQMKR